MSEESRFIISHSAKGSTWEKHKYIKVLNGRYFYPDSYKGGRHLDAETLEAAKAKGKRIKKKEVGSSTVEAEEKSKDEEVNKNAGEKHIPKEPIDPKNKEAVLKRINESLSRSSKSKVKASKGSLKKETSKEKSGDSQELAEQYAEKLEDAKINVEELKDLYQTSDKDEKDQIRKQLTEAQAELKKIRSQIKIKTKNNKELRKIISELTSND